VETMLDIETSSDDETAGYEIGFGKPI